MERKSMTSPPLRETTSPTRFALQSRIQGWKGEFLNTWTAVTMRSEKHVGTIFLLLSSHVSATPEWSSHQEACQTRLPRRKEHPSQPLRALLLVGKRLPSSTNGQSHVSSWGQYRNPNMATKTTYPGQTFLATPWPGTTGVLTCHWDSFQMNPSLWYEVPPVTGQARGQKLNVWGPVYLAHLVSFVVLRVVHCWYLTVWFHLLERSRIGTFIGMEHRTVVTRGQSGGMGSDSLMGTGYPFQVIKMSGN